jgi:hypothetical protein
MPAFIFQEQKHQVYYHQVRVFIFGTDVSDWLTGNVIIRQADRDGVNSCSFSLVNPLQTWEYTRDNVNGDFRLSGPPYSEIGKKQIMDRKANNRFNIQHPVVLLGPQVVKTDSGQKIDTVTLGLINGQNQVSDLGQSTGETTVSRYQFFPGSLVFHKYDPVRVFVANPLDPSLSQWACVFTGYLDVKPFSQDYTTGLSMLNIQCQDIRILMQNMRTQINPSQEIGGEYYLQTTTQKNGKPVAKAGVEAGIFGDQTAVGSIGKAARRSHVLGGLTWRQSINYLMFGESQGTMGSAEAGTSVTEEPSSKLPRDTGVAIGKLKLVPDTTFDPADDQIKKRQILENWNSKLVFGPKGDWLTTEEMFQVGTQTVPGEAYSPDATYVRFLTPAEGTPSHNMIQFNFDANILTRVEFVSKFELLGQMCKSVDYQFYVSPWGDVIFEFPMYDFNPRDFGDWEGLYTYNHHVRLDQVNDEGGPVVTGLTIESDFLQKDVSPPTANASNTGNLSLTSNAIRTVFSNLLANRLGVVVEVETRPGITDQKRLSQLAMMEFSKRLASFDPFEFEAEYRPLVGVNRPVLHCPRSRIGITKNTTVTWPIRDAVTSNLELVYVRKLDEDGRFRYITGAEASPVNYKYIYSLGDPKQTGITSGAEKEIKEQANVQPGLDATQSNSNQ